MRLSDISIVCIQYCLISAVCTVLLVYCAVITNRSAEHSAELLFYKLAMGFGALCSLMDMMFALREFGMLAIGAAANYTSEILYSLGSICGAFCWFVYSEKKQQSHIVASSRQIQFLAVPFALMSLLTLTTPLHKLCFSIEGQVYVRGVLNVPFTVICTAFVACSGIKALVSSFKKEYHSRSAFLRILFIYAVSLAAAQLMQVLIGSVMPFRSLTATVVFVFITLHGMSETVTIDAVSHINNRFSLNRVLDSRIFSGEKFWLTMIDIDDFKHINDTFGHSRGDDAIEYTALAITRSVPRTYFVARYGGDEFAIVSPLDDESEIRPLEEKIREELKKIIQEKQCPFSIDITAGYAARNDSINNIPDMIEAADRNLYKHKRRKKHAEQT